MADDNPRQSNKLAWRLGLYVLVAFLIAVGILTYMTPSATRESSPAERAVGDTHH